MRAVHSMVLELANKEELSKISKEQKLNDQRCNRKPQDASKNASARTRTTSKIKALHAMLYLRLDVVLFISDEGQGGALGLPR